MIQLVDSNNKPIDFSPEFKEAVKWKVKPGKNEEIIFQWKHTARKYKYTEERLAVDNGPVFGNHVHPNTFEVFDKWLNETIKVTYIEPGKRPDAPGIIMFHKTTECKITIDGSDPKLFDLLWVLRISPLNESNPLNGFDKAGTTHFVELQPEKAAKDLLNFKRLKREAEEQIEKAKPAELSAWMQALHLPVMREQTQNALALIEYIDDKTNFNKFLAISSDVRTEISELIRICENRGVVQYIQREAMWKFPYLGTDILRVHGAQEPYDALITFLHADKKGENIKEIMEREISKPREPIKPEVKTDDNKEDMQNEIEKLKAELKAEKEKNKVEKPKKNKVEKPAEV